MSYLAWDCGRHCVLITGGNGRLLDGLVEDKRDNEHSHLQASCHVLSGTALGGPPQPLPPAHVPQSPFDSQYHLQQLFVQLSHVSPLAVRYQQLKSSKTCQQTLLQAYQHGSTA